jgi:hypothetical protein
MIDNAPGSVPPWTKSVPGRQEMTAALPHRRFSGASVPFDFTGDCRKREQPAQLRRSAAQNLGSAADQAPSESDSGCGGDMRAFPSILPQAGRGNPVGAIGEIRQAFHWVLTSSRIMRKSC